MKQKSKKLKNKGQLRDRAELFLHMSTNMLERIHKATNHFVHYLVIVAVVLTLGTIVFIMVPPPEKTSAAGVPFGGRLLFTSPPVITGFVNCPAIATIANIGGPYKGVLHLMLPPAQPRAYYNFYSPGVAVLGSFLPTPIPFNCPIQPIYPAIYFGTSAR